MKPHVRVSLSFLGFLLAINFGLAAQPYASHPPLRPLPEPSKRPLANGPAFYVDATRGDDKNPGTLESPWRTINHALPLLEPGITLYLRGGIYREQVYCAIAGRHNSPITIRSYPGELAILDGSLPEFQLTPAEAWQPFPEGAPDEYISTRTYRNIRDVIGSFGDSLVGLQTYWYPIDLRAKNELLIKSVELLYEPIYCGPGLWYDKESGRIHIRLAHTTLQLPPTSPYQQVNYTGETDPRKLPLIIAPFDATPLNVSQAMHVRFQDLVIRGGGYTTVNLVFGVNLTFENCTIYAGTYGIVAKGTGPLTMTDCGVHGMVAPWNWLTDAAMNCYSTQVSPPFVNGREPMPDNGVAQVKGVNLRHFSRLTTHALLASAGNFEFDALFFPGNHDWDISNCDFTDSHDGIYIAGNQMRFHHNWVSGFHDDAIYLSSPVPLAAFNDQVRIYENVISDCNAPFGYHGRGGPGGDIYVYRNLIDQRSAIPYIRPSPEQPQGGVSFGGITFTKHGEQIHMERIAFYQNTVLQYAGWNLAYAGGLLRINVPDALRRVYNNLFLYTSTPTNGVWAPLPGYPTLELEKQVADIRIDGNLYWHLEQGNNLPPNWWDISRKHPLSLAAIAAGTAPEGWEAHSIVADPRLLQVTRNGQKANDYRLAEDSPAIGAGIVLPPDLEDPYRPPDNKPPDIGAFPFGQKPLRVGRQGHIEAGSLESLGEHALP